MRRKRNITRNIAPDPKYGNILLAQFINHLMKDGKKSVARAVMYRALDRIVKNPPVGGPPAPLHSSPRLGEAGEASGKSDAITLFESAIANVSPSVEVKSRRVGGATYQVPREVRGDRRITLAIRWILQASRAKKGKPMADRLADELALAVKNEGAAIKKKLDTHRMAEANKAFAHFSW
jgi:small subunit ribosomal protein S7